MLPEGPLLPLQGVHTRFGLEAERAGTATFEDRNLFTEALRHAVDQTNRQIIHAQDMGEAFAAGRIDDIHGTMVEMSKAEIELKTLGSVRNRVVDAFYEIWRMQI